MRARSATGARPKPCLARSTGLLLAAVVALGCGPAPTTSPTGGLGTPLATMSVAGSATPAALPSPSGPPAGPSGGSGTPGASGSAQPGGLPSSPLFTPPPEAPPQDDATCLAMLDRATVEAALGAPVAPVVAEGMDLNLQLSCEYPLSSGDGSFRLLFDVGDAENDYDREVDLASAAGQRPTPVDGVGDAAFHASATPMAPEQLVFRKGPVIVRFWNHTDQPLGLAAFTTLAGLAAAAIHAEVPPAP